VFACFILRFVNIVDDGNDDNNNDNKLSYHRDSGGCGTVKRSFSVIQGHPLSYQSTDIYHFLLALKTVIEIAHLVCTSIPHLSSKWNWQKTDGSRWTCFGVGVSYIDSLPRTLDDPTMNLNPR